MCTVCTWPMTTSCVGPVSTVDSEMHSKATGLSAIRGGPTVSDGRVSSSASFNSSIPGIGTLGIVDDDTVSLSNLQRQVIHDTGAVGTSKGESARAAIARINPHVIVELHNLRLTAENAAGIVRAYDVVVDGSDNFETRYALADACAEEKKPLVHAAVGRFDGSITVLKPFENGTDGRPNPTYRDLFPEAPPPGLVPSCAVAGAERTPSGHRWL